MTYDQPTNLSLREGEEDGLVWNDVADIGLKGKVLGNPHMIRHSSDKDCSHSEIGALMCHRELTLLSS